MELRARSARFTVVAVDERATGPRHSRRRAPMKWNLIAGAAALAMMSSAALAQSVSTQTTVQTPPIQTPPIQMAPSVTTGPAGSFSQTKTERSIDSNGVEVNKSQSMDKSQSFGSGDGQLN